MARSRLLDGLIQLVLAELKRLANCQRFAVARQTVHRWVARYRDSGIDGQADRSHEQGGHAWRISAEVRR